jgi:phosphopantothenoylcysteine decarboxylase / phosphopantothenate---cysteine ligase
VRTVMTESAREFVTPLSLGVLTEDHAYGDMFDLKEEREKGHIQHSREADLIVASRRPRTCSPKMARSSAMRPNPGIWDTNVGHAQRFVEF